jgi:hypothetical protein
MLALLRRPLCVLPMLGAVAILASVAFAAGATAQSASGTVTGRVLWSGCLRAIPLPASPDAQAQSPDTAQPAPGVRPIPAPISGLPAGAVLVAVQNTGVSARTDESGRFALAGVPAGQYLTVAAGPVADSIAATAGRPNVFVNGGESVDIGTLSLGATTAGIQCRFPVGIDAVPGTAQGGAPSVTPGDVPNP